VAEPGLKMATEKLSADSALKKDMSSKHVDEFAKYEVEQGL
jgi:hypothetical protein